MVKYKLNTGYGRIVVEAPLKYKGKNILPQVYKVRETARGRKFAIVGLYYREKGSLRVMKNLKVYID